MSLSEASYEILSDLLELRLESFLVTSTDEARELKMLKHCQRELQILQNMSKGMALPPPTVQPTQTVPASKLPRRLQRLIQEEAKKAG